MVASSIREMMREQLLESYRPRLVEGIACAKCTAKDIPLSYHLIKYSGSGPVDPPPGCVPMSARDINGSVGWTGSFPLCTRCAPTCSKCGLPIPTEALFEFTIKLQKSYGNGVSQGIGYCTEHIHWGSFFSALFKRAFRRGRFAGVNSRQPTE